MPYFKWKGIDWFGKISYGNSFARSKNNLEKKLLEQGIGLINSSFELQEKSLNKISLSIKVQFFKELATLINSGVLLLDALHVIKQQIKNIKFKKIVEEIEFEVKEGQSLSFVMSKYKNIFDELIIHVIEAGQESDKLNNSLLLLSEYLEKKETFKQKFRSVIFLPIITFCFFIIIALLIFLIILPSFSTIFSFTNQQIPKLTLYLLNVSFFLKDYFIVVATFFVFILIIIFYFLFRTVRGKIFLDKLILKVPFFGYIYKVLHLTYFLQATALMLKEGVTLVKALNITSSVVSNAQLKKNFNQLTQSVIKGNSLSEAMLLNDIFASNLISMVKVGEEAGNLDLMLNRAANFYFDQLQRSLTFFLTVIQPILMIILGVLIALLIFAVYLPLFNLPNLIQY